MEGDLQYLADQFGTFATNSFFVGATRVRDGDLIEAHVYWKERRTLLLYWARDDDEYLRSASATSWHKEWPLESGTVDPTDNAGCYRLHLDNWIMWMQECVKKGRRFTITKRKPNRVAPTDPWGDGQGREGRGDADLRGWGEGRGRGAECSCAGVFAVSS